MGMEEVGKSREIARRIYEVGIEVGWNHHVI